MVIIRLLFTIGDTVELASFVNSLNSLLFHRRIQSFVYISVHLIRQFVQFVTFFYPLDAFCLANASFAVSLLMSKQLVHVGIQSN